MWEELNLDVSRFMSPVSRLGGCDRVRCCSVWLNTPTEELLNKAMKSQ